MTREFKACIGEKSTDFLLAAMPAKLDRLSITKSLERVKKSVFTRQCARASSQAACVSSIMQPRQHTVSATSYSLANCQDAFKTTLGSQEDSNAESFFFAAFAVWKRDRSSTENVASVRGRSVHTSHWNNTACTSRGRRRCCLRGGCSTSHIEGVAFVDIVANSAIARAWSR